MDNRYSRQELYAPLGRTGQEAIRRGRLLVVGCGALGTHIANLCVRAGIGFVRIVDRDTVELSNLQRQVMFVETDVEREVPKALAAKSHLARINSDVEVEAVVADVNPRTVEKYLEGVDLVVDGTDNFETRYLLNDACVKHRLPWVYGGAVGGSGASLAFVPDGPCLACVWPEAPEPGQSATCDTVGIINTAPALVAALQVTEALKILAGTATRPTLWHVDLWDGQTASVKVTKNNNCPVCVQRRFEYLEAKATSWVTSLCGRNAVQIVPADPQNLDLEQLSEKLSGVGEASFNGFVLKVIIEGHTFSIFPDGRVMVHGTSDEARARTLHARYIGS